MTISLQSKVDELGRMLAMKQDDWLKALKEIEALESKFEQAKKLLNETIEIEVDLRSKLPRWRNVADELPEIVINVLAFGTDDRFEGEVQTLWLGDDGWWFDLHGVRWEGVTHWMPCPEAPKP